MRNALLLFLFYSFIFSSCETVVELDVPEKEPGLVANCFFNPDSVFYVNVSKSQYVLDNAGISKIKNATVSLFRESTWIEDLAFTSDGIYKSSQINRPEIGINYKISISAKGFTTIEANDITPFPSQITGIDTGSFFLNNQKYFEIKIGFKDNPDKKNYYQLQLLSKIYTMNFDSMGNISFDTTSAFYPMGFESNDLVFDDQKWFGSSGAMFTDALFGSKGAYNLSVYTYGYTGEDGMPGKAYAFDEVKVVLKSVSEAYYKYVVSYQKFQQNNGNPFSEPVQVYNNIRNGFGIFAGYSATSYTFKMN